MISCKDPGRGIFTSSLIVVRFLQRLVRRLLLRRENRDLVEGGVLVDDDAVLAEKLQEREERHDDLALRRALRVEEGEERDLPLLARPLEDVVHLVRHREPDALQLLLRQLVLPRKDLLERGQEVVARANEMPHEELKGIRFSVPDKMDYVLERTRKEGKVSFLSLFDAERAPKGEIIVTFLALLELLRQHRIIVYQNAAFHEITVLPSKEMPDDQPLEAPDEW